MILKLGLLCSHSNPQVRPTTRQVLHYPSGDSVLPDLSQLDFRGSEMTLGIHLRISEICMFTGGSLIFDSILTDLPEVNFKYQNVCVYTIDVEK